MKRPPLSLYIHIPWCVRKCPYCDFNSHAAKQPLPEQEYVNALRDDLADELRLLDQAPNLHSIFIGGGTPSLFSAESIAAILEDVDRQMGIASTTEVTLEANPGTFEQERFKGFKKAGVNRLSIGIQSFNDAHLQRLGRIHSSENAINAATYARTIFDNINLDLMHGLPEQTTDQALADLQQAIALEPDHLSWYQLTLEPNTEFHARPPTLPLDEALWEIQEFGQALLAESGYQQYEISAYARANKRSQHNVNYWQFGDYLGIGAGAHGKVTQTSPHGLSISRHHKSRQPKAYLNPMTRIAERTQVEASDLAFEFMLNTLRLHEGVPTQLLLERTGLSLDAIESRLKMAQAKGLLHPYDTQLKPTQQGRLFLNDLLEMFL
ncbi:radical SAM family heme chaperone HemW [Nitrincola nitratireducens]|uniref:Heme chaperone HemW n=1 Tax=Nitrincola nitratireducens TaxID=1229521 RepID=W9UYS9_9GAMM|nr:radical SAM family heme chaperone HemW [Nitrincola nitratireducens]EXJ12373.1 Oxygen-independent coproporphyrinogen-III oxidase [Nitrincola nitratireducens]